MKTKTNKGFTLIEMLIVVAIVGILATVVLFAVSRARKKAVASQMMAHATELMKAVEMAGTDGCSNLWIDTNGSVRCNNSSGTIYISKFPTSPTCPSNRCCGYYVISNGSGNWISLRGADDANGDLLSVASYSVIAFLGDEVDGDCYANSGGGYFRCDNGSCSCYGDCLTIHY